MNTAQQLKLVKKAVKGNPDAYGELIAEYQNYLYKTTYLYVKNEEAALDVVGTAVLKAYLQIHTLKNPGYFKTWITRILINAAYDEQKKFICHSEWKDNLREASHTEVSLEEKYDINAAITQLSEKYRTVIILKYFSEFSVKEIAEIMNAPEGSVKAYLSRARDELKRILKEDIYMQIRLNEIPVPKEKLDAVVGENMQKVRNIYKVKKRRRNLASWISAAAAVALICLFCFTNPVLAAKIPLIGHIFQRVQDVQRYSGNFHEVAQPLADHNSAVSDGVTITLSEIYSNQEAMYVSVMIETEEPFPEEVKESNIVGDDNVGYHMCFSIEQEFDFMEEPEAYEPFEWPGKEYKWTELDIKGEYTDDHTFVGAFRTDYNLYPIGLFEVPDAFNWKLKVNRIDVLGRYAKEGSWEFETGVTIDTREPEVITVNESAPNGSVLTAVTMTPYEVRVDYEYDESKVQPGYEDYSSVQGIMLDADGKCINDKAGMFPTAGYNLSRIYVYYFETRTEEEYMEIQEKIYNGNLGDELQEYLEGISIQKTIVELE